MFSGHLRRLMSKDESVSLALKWAPVVAMVIVVSTALVTIGRLTEKIVKLEINQERNRTSIEAIGRLTENVSALEGDIEAIEFKADTTQSVTQSNKAFIELANIRVEEVAKRLDRHNERNHRGE